MITQELKVLVKEEAEKLKKHATAGELDELNFLELNPGKTRHCIYGQMTGYCYSIRASDLLKKCTVPYSFELDIYVRPQRAVKFFSGQARAFFSPIEFYIAQPESKKEALINFLKSETETLEL